MSSAPQGRIDPDLTALSGIDKRLEGGQYIPKTAGCYGTQGKLAVIDKYLGQGFKRELIGEAKGKVEANWPAGWKPCQITNLSWRSYLCTGESANTGSHWSAARGTMGPVEGHRWVKIHRSGEEIDNGEQIQDGGIVEGVVQSL